LRQPGTFAGRLRTPASQKDIFQMTIKDNVHAALPSGRTPPISAQNLRDAIDLVIDYVPTVAGTGGGGGSVVTGAAATFDTLATLQAATVDPALTMSEQLAIIQSAMAAAQPIAARLAASRL
jgi:hypothetical protein